MTGRDSVLYSKKSNASKFNVLKFGVRSLDSKKLATIRQSRPIIKQRRSRHFMAKSIEFRLGLRTLRK